MNKPHIDQVTHWAHSSKKYAVTIAWSETSFSTVLVYAFNLKEVENKVYAKYPTCSIQSTLLIDGEL